MELRTESAPVCWRPAEKASAKSAILLISGVFIVTAYTITLLIYNFQTELIYGFRNFALTGRYLFPVVGLIYGLYGFTLELIRNKILQILTLLGTIALFLMFGPVQFLWHYNGVFSSWFLR